MPGLARSVEQVPHSRIRELAEIAMSMDGVLRLYFGESNLPTPDYIKQAAVRAMNEGYTFYTENAGLPSLRGERYRIDFDALEIAVNARTRLLVYTSPSNPLGWVATEQEQQGLLDFARRHDLWLLADEVYDRLGYTGAHLGDPVPSILRKATRGDAVIVVQSFSKTYCMTGWRLGYLIARRDL